MRLRNSLEAFKRLVLKKIRHPYARRRKGTLSKKEHEAADASDITLLPELPHVDEDWAAEILATDAVQTKPLDETFSPSSSIQHVSARALPITLLRLDDTAFESIKGPPPLMELLSDVRSLIFEHVVSNLRIRVDVRHTRKARDRSLKWKYWTVDRQYLQLLEVSRRFRREMLLAMARATVIDLNYQKPFRCRRTTVPREFPYAHVQNIRIEEYALNWMCPLQSATPQLFKVLLPGLRALHLRLLWRGSKSHDRWIVKMFLKANVPYRIWMTVNVCNDKRRDFDGPTVRFIIDPERKVRLDLSRKRYRQVRDISGCTWKFDELGLDYTAVARQFEQLKEREEAKFAGQCV